MKRLVLIPNEPFRFIVEDGQIIGVVDDEHYYELSDIYKSERLHKLYHDVQYFLSYGERIDE